MKSKKAQHEMMGFALIIIMVAIIGLVFFSLTKPDKENNQPSPLAENFLESVLHHTTNCSKYSSGPPYLQIKDLSKICAQEGFCNSPVTACESLNHILDDILNNSFKAGVEFPLKAYQFLILSEGEAIINKSIGNKTSNSMGSSEKLANDLDFYLTLYY